MLDEEDAGPYLRYLARYGLAYMRLAEEVSAMPPAPPIYAAPLKKIGPVWSPIHLRPDQVQYQASPSEITLELKALPLNDYTTIPVEAITKR
jgi:hypothetical protein